MELVMHRGAGSYAPDNSTQALQWALEHQPDRVEIDLLEHHGQVYLAHDLEHLDSSNLLLSSAEEMLRNSGISLMLDLKNYTPSLLQQTAYTFDRPQWQDRIIVSSRLHQDARQVARQIPGASSAWSLPQLDLTGVNVPPPLDHEDMIHWRDVLPQRISREIQFRAFDFLSLQYELLSAPLFEMCAKSNIGIYAWTAQDQDKLAELTQLPLAGVVSEISAN